MGRERISSESPTMGAEQRMFPGSARGERVQLIQGQPRHRHPTPVFPMSAVATFCHGDHLTSSSSSSPPAVREKKMRNLPGNPDYPDPAAEVIALSPETLMTTNRFVCEICSRGFQREQNLQLHRRGHKLPWTLRQRARTEAVPKRVYVCPDSSCIHHNPRRALGDLTGIKKHFCRKHGEKKWKCDKCSKKYAVQSDLKAHSKTCGTREYKCGCGTVFSRRDSFLSHRAFCDALAKESKVEHGIAAHKMGVSSNGQIHDAVSPDGVAPTSSIAVADLDEDEKKPLTAVIPCELFHRCLDVPSSPYLHLGENLDVFCDGNGSSMAGLGGMSETSSTKKAEQLGAAAKGFNQLARCQRPYSADPPHVCDLQTKLAEIDGGLSMNSSLFCRSPPGDWGSNGIGGRFPSSVATQLQSGNVNYHGGLGLFEHEEYYESCGGALPRQISSGNTAVGFTRGGGLRCGEAYTTTAGSERERGMGNATTVDFLGVSGARSPPAVTLSQQEQQSQRHQLVEPASITDHNQANHLQEWRGQHDWHLQQAAVFGHVGFETLSWDA